MPMHLPGSHRAWTAWLLLAAAALGAVMVAWVSPHSSLAQAPPAPTAQSAAGQQPGAPAVRVTSRLVQIDVIVRDKNGQAVPGLTAADFTLTDGGRAEKIAFVIPPSAASAAMQRSAPPVPPNTFSNRLPSASSAPPNVTIILFDALNTSFNDQAYAKSQVLGLLKQIQLGDHVAIYLLARDLSVLQDFTTDVAPLVIALEKFEGYLSPQAALGDPSPKDSTDYRDVPGSGVRNTEEVRAIGKMNEFMQATRQRLADFANKDRAERTLASLEGIANHVAPLSGRKNLIWVSASFPFSIGALPSESELNALYPNQDHRTFREEILRTTRALNRANVAIYPVDVRGLIGAFSGKGFFDMVQGTRTEATGGLQSDPLKVGKMGVAGENPNEVKFDRLAPTRTTMQLLAERTGGRAFYDNNDVRGAIRRAIDDSHAAYVLGYYPTHDKWDNSFREVRVKLDRPGVELHYRRGYVAVPDTVSGKAERLAALREAAASPLEATSLGVTAHLDLAPQGTPGVFRLKLDISPDELQLREEKGNYLGGLDFLVVQRDAQGKTVDTFVATQPIELPAQVYAQARQYGLGFNLDVPRKPGSTSATVVVRDASSAAIGSVLVPLAPAASK
jgi:VWFA-related protein